MGDVSVPIGPGAVCLLIVGEAVAAQEALAHVGDVGLDLALGLRPVGAAEADAKAVVVGRGERLGMQAPLALKALGSDVGAHHGLRAVIEQLGRDAAEVGKGGAVTGPEGHEVKRAHETAEGVARVAEHHVEAVEGQLEPRARPDRLLVGPVDLGLVAGRGLKAALELGVRPRARALDVAAHRLVAAAEAVVAHEVLVDPRRLQARLAGEPLVNHRLDPIELRGLALAAVDGLRAVDQVAAHRPPVAAHQPADLGVGKPLSVQGPDVHELLLVDHRRLQVRSIERTWRRVRTDPRGPKAPLQTYTFRWSWSDILRWSWAGGGEPVGGGL